jgi:hypothetical protein
MKLNFFSSIILSYILVFFINFWGFWQSGIEGNDAVFYIRVALEWVNQNFVFTYPGNDSFFRPILFALMSLSYKIFGIKPYALKIFNLLTFLSIAWTMFKISDFYLKSFWRHVPFLLVALIPKFMLQSRVELAHLISTLFVLLTFYFLLKFQKNQSRKFLVCSSIFAHFAMSAHTDLAFIAPSMVFILFFHEPIKNFKVHFKNAFIFTAVYFLPFIIYHLIWNLPSIIEMIKHNQAFPKIVPGKSFPDLFFEFWSTGLRSLIGTPFTQLFYLSGIFYLFRKFRLKEITKDEIKLIFPLFLYTLLFEILIKRNVLSPLVRLLIPFIPMVMIFIVLQISKYFEQTKNIVKKSTIILFLVIAVFYPWKDYPFLPSLAYYDPQAEINFLKYKTAPQEVFHVLKSQVDSNQKVLIAPSQINEHYDLYNLPFYFNGNAVSLKNCLSPMKIENFLISNKIKYIYIASLRNFKQKWIDKTKEENTPFCLLQGRFYEGETEVHHLMLSLIKFPLKMIYDHPYYGSIYSINLDKD